MPASSVFLKYQTVEGARSGHLRISGWEAFSLLRFFFAVGKSQYDFRGTLGLARVPVLKRAG
jgi:hypothetical protein